MGSNPGTNVYWMDIFTLICYKICLKRPKKTIKEAGVGPFKKRFTESALSMKCGPALNLNGIKIEVANEVQPHLPPFDETID